MDAKLGPSEVYRHKEHIDEAVEEQNPGNILHVHTCHLRL
jgi:hypothetical protein